MSQLSVPYVALPEQVTKLKTALMQSIENVLLSGQYVLGEKGRFKQKPSKQKKCIKNNLYST